MKHIKATGYLLIIVAAIFAATLVSVAQQHRATEAKHPSEHTASTCPMMQGSDKSPAAAEGHGHDDIAEMNMRGEREMGFSQEQTTHHFRLTKDGGTIEVEVNDTNDTGMRDRIRQHLEHISRAFSDGDFTTPFAVHDRVPPGVPVMKRLKAAIQYIFEETERGGRVRISTSDSEALAAIQEFLRFQITEHRTGDPLK